MNVVLPALGRGKTSLASLCFEAANGDPLLALDLACNVIVRLAAERRARAHA